MKGKVKFFNTSKGFGFILGEDNQDYFVHISKVIGRVDGVLEKDEEVEFDVTATARGNQAINVVVI